MWHAGRTEENGRIAIKKGLVIEQASKKVAMDSRGPASAACLAPVAGGRLFARGLAAAAAHDATGEPELGLGTAG